MKIKAILEIGNIELKLIPENKLDNDIFSSFENNKVDGEIEAYATVWIKHSKDGEKQFCIEVNT